MTDIEKVVKAYENFVNGYECFCTSDDNEYEMHKAVLALLKEQDERKRKVLQHLADVQLGNAPNEYHNETQRMYEKGVYDGIQMAFEIIAEHG